LWYSAVFRDAEADGAASKGDRSQEENGENGKSGEYGLSIKEGRQKVHSLGRAGAEEEERGRRRRGCVCEGEEGEGKNEGGETRLVVVGGSSG
jgi:hypothetical protein